MDFEISEVREARRQVNEVARNKADRTILQKTDCAEPIPLRFDQRFAVRDVIFSPSRAA